MIAATALGTKEQILAAAAKVEGLTDLRVTAEKGDEVSFTATSTAGADLRAALSKALAEAGCPVVSLTSDTIEFGGYLPTDHRDCTGGSPAGRNRRTGSGSGCRTAGTVC